MGRLIKRTPNGVAYMAIADTLPKREQEIEGSKPILEGLYAMFQKLADFEDKEEQEKVMDNKKFSKLMYFLIKEACQYDFTEFLENCELTKEDYNQIRDYLKAKYGIEPYV